MKKHKGWETKLRSLKFEQIDWKYEGINFSTYIKKVAPYIKIELNFAYSDKERKNVTETNLCIRVHETATDLNIINWRKFQQFIDAFNPLIHAR